MILKNGRLVNEDFDLVQMDLRTEGDRIREIGANLTGEETLDCAGCIVTRALWMCIFTAVSGRIPVTARKSRSAKWRVIW